VAARIYKRHHLSVPGPDGGCYPIRVAERRAKALTAVGELLPALDAYSLNAQWADRSGDPRQAAEAQLALAIHLVMLSRYDNALEHLDRAEELFQAAGAGSTAGTVMLWRAKVLSSRGHFDRALELLDGLERGLSPGDDGLAMSIDALRGNINFWRGDIGSALEAFERQHAHAVSRGVKETELSALINIGLALREQGALDRAAELLERAMAVARRFGYAAYYAIALGSLGGVHLYRRRPRMARDCYLEQLRLTERMGDAYSACCATGDLGGVYIELGELDDARHLIRRELALCREMQDDLGVTFARFKLGVVETDDGRLDDALELVRESVAGVRGLNTERFLGMYLVQLAEIHCRRGEHAEAWAALREALPLRQGGSETDRAKALLRERLRARSDPAAAEADLLRLLDACPEDRAAAYRALHEATGKEEYRQRALELLEEQQRREPTRKAEREIAALRGGAGSSNDAAR